MKQSIRLLFPILLLSAAFLQCDSGPATINFNKGDNWVEKLYKVGEQGDLQHFTISGSKLYTTTTRVGQTNYLYCLDLQTGTVDWTQPLDDYCAFAPLAPGDIVYALTYTGHIYALSLEGKLLWEQKTELYADFSRNPLNNNLLVSSITNGILEYDKNTGALLRHIGQATYHPALPAFYNDTMIIGGLKAPDNNTLGNGNDLVAFQYKPFREIWRTQNYMGSFVWDENSVFYLDQSFNLHKTNPKTGKDDWVVPLNPDGKKSFFVEACFPDKGHVFFLINEQNKRKVYMIDGQTGAIHTDERKNLQARGWLLPETISGNIPANKRNYEYIFTTDRFVFPPKHSMAVKKIK